jgi:hypothetical protein
VFSIKNLDEKHIYDFKRQEGSCCISGPNSLSQFAVTPMTFICWEIEMQIPQSWLCFLVGRVTPLSPCHGPHTSQPTRCSRFLVSNILPPFVLILVDFCKWMLADPQVGVFETLPGQARLFLITHPHAHPSVIKEDIPLWNFTFCTYFMQRSLHPQCLSDKPRVVTY